MSDVIVDANGSRWYSPQRPASAVRPPRTGDVIRHKWLPCPDTFRVTGVEQEEILLERVPDGLEHRTSLDDFDRHYAIIEEAGS